MSTPAESGPRRLTFAQAIHEALDQLLESDDSVFVMGEGVPDPKGIFGTTSGLQEKFGASRVLDMPVSENGCTGVALGAAVKGLRPVIMHQRVDFSLYAMEQMINHAAKWHSMFGGGASAPMLVRAIIGRGWGQGNQHSQNLQSLYAHVPGLKVVAPFTAQAAKGLLVAGVQDPNPVVFLEHRWLHNTVGDVSAECEPTPRLGEARVARQGSDLTLVAWSYYTLEALRAAEHLEEQGVSAEVIDLQTLSPMDSETIRASVRRTGRLLVVDGAWRFGGLAGEIVAQIAEDESVTLRARPKRVTFPDCPCPSTPYLAHRYYPRASDVLEAAGSLLGRAIDLDAALAHEASIPHDVPDPSFTGPF